MLEENKEIVRRFVDEYQTGRDEGVADELVASDFVHHYGRGWTEASTEGREGVKLSFAAMLHAPFPDLRAVIHDQIAEGDKVVTRKTFYGTHRGQFAGVPPTGKEVAIDAIDIVRIANGQIVDHWAVTDVMGFMQQVGAVPLPPSAAAG